MTKDELLKQQDKLTQEFNAAIANGLRGKARAIQLRVLALERRIRDLD